MKTEYKYTALLLDHICTTIQQSPGTAENCLQLMKLANLGKLMGGVAHTFNNILGGILGYSQLLKEELQADSDAYRQAQVIEAASKRASRLISQLQVYAQNHSGYKRIVDPKTVVEEVLAIVASSFGKNIKTSTSYHHANARIIIDFAATLHVLLTLCLNAKEAMPDGGQIDIATELERDDQIEHGADTSGRERNGCTVIFKVSDTGVGIKQEHLARVFEPFFSTKPPELASGLGLTMAQSIARDHGGEITVESQEGKGATFSLHIPAANKPLVSATSRKTAGRENKNGRGEVIMVVDDEIELCLMAKKILENKGYAVIVANSGRSAIKELEEHANEIQLVILDMNMPGEDGVKVYQTLKQLSTQSKVILTSGYTYNSPYQHLIDKAKDPFIPKPWDLPELIKETRRVLAGS
ncbi:MAG: response regulator [bacterium]